MFPGLQRSGRSADGPCVSRYPEADRSLTRLLADQAAARPDKPWLVLDGRETLTFGAAWRQVRRVAARLGEAMRGGCVVVMAPTSLEYVLAVHGTMLAGGCCVLMDPNVGATALDAILKRSGPTLVFTDAAGRDRLRELNIVGPELVILSGSRGPEDIGWTNWLGAPPVADPVFPKAGDDALVMHTSGTTGTPKGVVISHHYAFIYGALVTDALQRTEDDVLIGPLALFHASGLQMIVHSALHAGCTAHLNSRFSVSRFWHDVALSGATQGNLMPEMARMLLARVAEAPPHRMRRISIGGLAERDDFERRFGVEVLWQGFGMTEVYVAPMALEPIRSSTLGLPMDHLMYGALDDDGRPVAPGQPGELVVGPLRPHWMFDRYLADPETTAAALAGGVFHTGDLVSIDEAGVLTYRGRKGERIRVRGEHIYPAEVERVAIQFPGVREAVAFGIPADVGGEDVKLDIVADAPVDVAGLHAWLASQVSRHATPRYIEVRTDLPRTASGKITRHALKAEGVNRLEVWQADDRRDRSS